MESDGYIISVSEPWNFESLDGENIIKGKVQSILSNTCIVFKSNHRLKFDDREGSIFVLSPRHKNNYFYNIDTVLNVNVGLLLMEYRIELSEQELKSNSKFVIIGSLKRE